MKQLSIVCALTVLALFTDAARGDLILQDEYNWTVQVLDYGPIGQTFTAEDPTVTIGFWVVDRNEYAGEVGLSVELYEGAGTNGGTSRV